MTKKERLVLLLGLLALTILSNYSYYKIRNDFYNKIDKLDLKIMENKEAINELKLQDINNEDIFNRLNESINGIVDELEAIKK